MFTISEKCISISDLLLFFYNIITVSQKEVGFNSYPLYEDARARAFDGMSEDDIGYVETFVSDIYVPLEVSLHDGALENAIKDPQHPVWTIFDKTGEIITGYAYEQEICIQDRSNPPRYVSLSVPLRAGAGSDLG
ncbi:hypothetical protein H6B11_14795 [Mediterraneibacter glycyrrhizinilyticus]|nr:hypothetical protein [Mediterraneibacter glycyrrhizinilyticus]MBM6855399.1 hypothetical protein [Mediterraneibacter glycyrrhizinilyticus]